MLRQQQQERSRVRESDARLLWSDRQLPVSGRNDTGARTMHSQTVVPTLLSHSEPVGCGPRIWGEQKGPHPKW